MIRYYEQIGLTRPALRTVSSYRVYGDQDVHTLQFVRRARDLGFSVKQIKELLALWGDRSRNSADVRAVALEHIAELESKIAAIEEMTKTPKHLANHCHGDDRPECPIIEEIAKVTDGKSPRVNARFGLGALSRKLRGVAELPIERGHATGC
ncbi:Cu(I)-responsive transcriptional regulator [Sinorhizobium sp. M4_45]|nr:Cu(I)-responsive transcriptional regulator [Sinorhizobium sp. M4_45]